MHTALRVIPICAALICLAACGSWQIEPLPPEQRGPQTTRNDPPPGPAPSGSGVVVIERVDCAACMEVLGQRLRGVPGVEAVAVDRESGRAVVTPRAGYPVSPEALRTAATQGGFTVLRVDTP